MKRRTAAAALAAILALSIGVVGRAQDAPKPPPKPADVAGKWTMTLEMSIGTGTPTLEIKQDGAKITGTYTGRYGAAAITGTVTDHAIVFSCSIDAEGQSATMNFRGDIAVDGQSMRGSAEIEGLGDATWAAKKAPK
jgi:hypothetical protein